MIHQVASSFPHWAISKVFPAVSGSTAVAAEVRRGRRHCRHFTVSKVSSSANIYPPHTLSPKPPSRHPQGSKSISHYTDLKRLLSSFSSCRYHLRAASGFWILFIVFCHTKEKASETVVNVDVKVIWLEKRSRRQTVALQRDLRLFTHLYKETEEEKRRKKFPSCQKLQTDA